MHILLCGCRTGLDKLGVVFVGEWVNFNCICLTQEHNIHFCFHIYVNDKFVSKFCFAKNKNISTGADIPLKKDGKLELALDLHIC